MNESNNEPNSKVGTTTNNLVTVASQEYENGKLTKSIQYVDSSTTRDTLYSYDWRNRQTTTTQPYAINKGFKSVSTSNNRQRPVFLRGV